MDEITPAEVIEVPTPIWQTQPDTAAGTRQKIATVMKWAITEGHRLDNPAGDAIDAALPKQTRKIKHMRALHHSAVAGSIAQVRESDAWTGTKLAYEFVAFTAARIGEAVGATRDEIDHDAALWTLPPERTKTGREYRIPLSGKALEVLDEAREIADSSGLLFPTITGRVMHSTALAGLLRDLGIGGTTHGLRSSFRDWAAENGVDDKVAEMCLAHINSDRTEAAYLRTDMIEARRRVLEDWADYLS